MPYRELPVGARRSGSVCEWTYKGEPNRVTAVGDTGVARYSE